MKEEIREMTDRLREVEKLDKDEHQKVIDSEEQLRALKRALKQSPPEQGPDQAEIAHDTEILEQELAKLKDQKKQKEKFVILKLRKFNSQTSMIQHEVNILNIKLKEKEQEDKLNDLKIKELKRFVPYGSLKPIDNNFSQPISQNSKHRPTNMNYSVAHSQSS